MWNVFRNKFKRLASQKLILLYLLFACLICTTIIIHGLSPLSTSFDGSPRYDNCHGGNAFSISDEEKRVFQTVRAEHVSLVEKLERASEDLDAINKLIPVRETELRELNIQIEELELLRRDYNNRHNVQLKLPHPPLMSNGEKSSPEEDLLYGSEEFFLLEESFNFSRCSISRRMQIFLYPLPENCSASAKSLHSEFLLQTSRQITENPEEACLFIAILEKGNMALRQQFEHFGSTGRNHLLLDLNGELRANNVEAALLISPVFSRRNKRPSMDLTLFLSAPNSNQNIWIELSPLLPAFRKYFISFLGNRNGLTQRQLTDFDELKNSMDSSKDSYFIEMDCGQANNSFLCHTREQRTRVLRQSTFSLILPEDPQFSQNFYELLEAGSIPVICSLHASLPFDEFVDWRQAVIRIPSARFPELHFILRSISVSDLLEMRRKGRFFFEHFLADSRVLVRSILSTMRFRLQIPLSDEKHQLLSLPLYKKLSNESSAWEYPSFISTATRPPYDDEYLGPFEKPLISPQYSHNFTAFSVYASKIWNDFSFSTFSSPRFLPNDHPLPSDAEFNEDTSFGMRPILSGSGLEFSRAMGGNRPREHFTILITTFNREQSLASTLERLIGLPYLNKVIVVWNDVHNPPSLSAWPRLRVPLLFINGTKNSLNNRFVPYNEIETEAVLSMDDDIDLKQYEIIFAFRVWREQRDRIVGFPARYHARFGDSNTYDSNHTCQYSMILTGAAFLHIFYLHTYTYHMPEIIREKVDQWMNCEDIAMNFLVSHLTRKPPIKTTSKWTLRCPTCTEMLSNDPSHFSERHECIRFFTHVYGYNPLLFSQFRADSVLFKTRVPANHQKCFRYV